MGKGFASLGNATRQNSAANHSHGHIKPVTPTTRMKQSFFLLSAGSYIERLTSSRNLEEAIRHLNNDGLVAVEDAISHEYLDHVNVKLVKDAETPLARVTKALSTTIKETIWG